MVNIYKYSVKNFAIVFSVVGLSLITGCDHTNSFEDLERQSNEFRNAQHEQAGEGRKLAEVAGKATLPSHEQNSTKKLQLSERAQQLVGRYRVVVDCADPFVHCDRGSAEFILNLLPDGTAHRIFIHMGKVTYNSNNHYRRDTWAYDHGLDEVILIRGSGVQFYYDIDQQGNLMMNLDKIANFTPENRQYFSEGHPFPKLAYKLSRVD